MAGLFQVLWGREGGEFSKATPLTDADGKALEIPQEGEQGVTESICTRPFAVDWNDDGHLDLVVGVFSGSFYLFNGKAGATFAPVPVRLEAEGRPLVVEGSHGDPFVVDWDGDGDLDLVSGSDHGGVQWAINSAGAGQPPRLSGFQTLVAGGPVHAGGDLVSEESLTGPEQAYRVWVEDVNRDGKLDLLVGDNVTLRRAADGVGEGDYFRRYKDWQKRMSEMSDEMRKIEENTGGDEKARDAVYERYRKVYEERSGFMNEGRTGYVWLFVRK